ncbi:MAG: His/Gly/Thr/Pro-type tRNA ligase C-terminal domain-containing protein [Lachnospiraceae bacterium]|nr:His/Gly/Thr/Pro-type tRNA ligase C-terminal domain-containing protein [Lachnospiraceae bacterium]
MNPKVWEASGHLAGFSDPLLDCKECKTRHRADNLIQDYDKSVNADAMSQEEDRIVFNIKPALAPIKINILPLIKKKHAKKARELYTMLVKYFMVQYDESGSIGKRYRRGDAIGIPYAITVDDATLEQETVTVRDRDTMEQCVIPVSELITFLSKKLW